MHSTGEVETLRVQLIEAQRAQQTLEIALANEREANIAEGVRAMIDNAIRERTDAHHERDCMRRDRDMARAALDKAQTALQRAQRAARGLEQQVARLVGENRRLGPSPQLAVTDSCRRYSPLAADCARHHRHRPARAPRSPATPTLSLPNSALSPVSTLESLTYAGRNDLSRAEPLRSPPIDDGRPRLPLQPKWTLCDVPSNENTCDIQRYIHLRQLKPGVRVGTNGVENPADLHAYLWRCHLRQLQAQASDATDRYLYGCVNDQVDAILCRPGRYAELVTALFPDVSLDSTLDPATSKLGQEYMFDVSSLAHGDEIEEEDVVRWMYSVLNVSREAVRLELEPYFRRRAHYYLAVQAWRDVLVQGPTSADTRTSMSLLLGSHYELERFFHGCQSFPYPPHAATLFLLESDIIVWHLPEGEAEVEDVAVDLAWLPTCIAQEVAVRYRELCTASGV